VPEWVQEASSALAGGDRAININELILLLSELAELAADEGS
jgi:hypothetical protein